MHFVHVRLRVYFRGLLSQVVERQPINWDPKVGSKGDPWASIDMRYTILFQSLGVELSDVW